MVGGVAAWRHECPIERCTHTRTQKRLTWCVLIKLQFGIITSINMPNIGNTSETEATRGQNVAATVATGATGNVAIGSMRCTSGISDAPLGSQMN